MGKEGSFREDLFYLMNVFPIHLPPLRERREDIPALTEHFLRRSSKASEKKSPPFSPGALKRLILHDWPGNVRELENVVHRAVILSKGKTVRPEHILITGSPGTDVPRTAKELKAMKRELRARSVTDLERAFVIAALERAQWNATKAARDVGMQRTNFQALLRRHGIRREAR
jgi:two-component system NtrC family response regulator